jgi:hypothetical protein
MRPRRSAGLDAELFGALHDTGMVAKGDKLLALLEPGDTATIEAGFSAR